MSWAGIGKGQRIRRLFLRVYQLREHLKRAHGESLRYEHVREDIIVSDTAFKISVMQAWADRKPIQVECNGHWVNCKKEPSWNWQLANWRIKPDPKEIWVNEYLTETTRGFTAFDNKEEAIKSGVNPTRAAVKYREVIDDET